MRNQWSFRTKSRLKVVDNSVKISQVIGKKNSNGQPFYPTFTNTTVVLVSEDKRVYETTKATADGAGNLTFLKRGLADDGTDIEVAKFKKAWMPGTLMYVTFASEDYDKKADISSVPTKTSDLTNDSGFIDNTVNDLVNYTKTSDLGAVATSNDYNDLDNKLTAGANIAIDPDTNEISATDTIPNNATIKVQKNGTDIESFTANESTNKTINITVPTQASDVGALPDSTKYGANLSLSINSSTYVVAAQLKDQDGNNLGTAQTIDLPLESVVVSGSYDSATKKVILTLQDGSTIEFSVADLVAGLQTEITNSNKLDADLVDDSTSTNKFVTAADLTKLSNTSGVNTGDQSASDFDIKDLADTTGLRNTWSGKQDAINDLNTIRDNASSGKAASDTIATYGDVVTHDADEFATSAQGAKADTALQSGDDISELNNDVGYVTSAYHDSTKQDVLTAGDNVTIDNNEISVDLDGYQTIDNMVQNLDDADHSHYPTAKAVKDAIVSGGLGDVSGPNSSVDGNVVLFDGTTGKTIKDSGVNLSDKQDTLTAGNGIDIDANNKISTTFIYGESTTAAATVQKEVSIPSITELNVGQVIIVKPTVTSTVAASTLKLNSFPAYKMLYNAAEITTSTDSIVWTANVPSMFYLDEVSGTRYWRFLGHGLDSNTTYTLNRLIDPSRYKVGTGTYAFSRYSLVMEKADGTWEKITNTAAAYSTGTTKTVNTNGFRLGHIRYYNTATDLANGALVAASALDIQAPSVTAAYSFNCGTAPGWAVGTPIYLVGSMGADGLFYLDTTQRWSTQLPSTNDGKLYIRLGTALSADNSTFSLLVEKPIFYYDNGIKQYIGGVTSVNGNTGAVTVSEFEPDNVGTTDQVLTKTADGYEWTDATGGGTVMDEADYQDLPSPQNDFLYFTFE